MTEYHDAPRKGATHPLPDRPVEASEGQALDNSSSEYALSGASKLLEPRHPNTIPIDANDYQDLPARPNLSLVVAHPRLVPWWIGDDLSPTEARRMLKALTSTMVVLAKRAHMEPGEVVPLLKAVVEAQDTGDDRRDLQTGMELIYDALGAHGL